LSASATSPSTSRKARFPARNAGARIPEELVPMALAVRAMAARASARSFCQRGNGTEVLESDDVVTNTRPIFENLLASMTQQATLVSSACNSFWLLPLERLPIMQQHCETSFLGARPRRAPRSRPDHAPGPLRRATSSGSPAKRGRKPLASSPKLARHREFTRLMRCDPAATLSTLNLHQSFLPGDRRPWRRLSSLGPDIALAS